MILILTRDDNLQIKGLVVFIVERNEKKEGHANEE